MAKRPDYSVTVVKLLFAQSGNCCGFLDPGRGGCEEALTDPQWGEVKGQIVHIRGFAPGSARYDADMTNAERMAFDNLLLFCPNHHVLVDRLLPELFSGEMLEEMKAKGLEASLRHREAWATDDALNWFAGLTIRRLMSELQAAEIFDQGGPRPTGLRPPASGRHQPEDGRQPLSNSRGRHGSGLVNDSGNGGGLGISVGFSEPFNGLPNPGDVDSRVHAALRAHFDGGGREIRPLEIAHLSGLGQPAVERSLARLLRARKIDGISVEEQDFPIIVVGTQ
jgi:hypothetical protein